ncbi:nucleoside-diphosphate-sugar epimerase [Rhizobium leguminosarum]|nr:nucleoside-diphosphate-sugar epimerase [Rhizobium leguminosarum]
MKITVMGASGRIGTRLVEDLPQARIEVVSASPSLTGVDSVTGEGLRSAISGADVVIDVTNAASRRPWRGLAVASPNTMAYD